MGVQRVKPVDSIPRSTDSGRFKLLKVISERWSASGECTGMGTVLNGVSGKAEGAGPNHWPMDLANLDKNDTGLIFP